MSKDLVIGRHQEVFPTLAHKGLIEVTFEEIIDTHSFYSI